MIDFHNAFSQVFINFLTVKPKITLMEFIFLLNPVTEIHGHLFRSYSNP